MLVKVRLPAAKNDYSAATNPCGSSVSRPSLLFPGDAHSSCERVLCKSTERRNAVLVETEL